MTWSRQRTTLTTAGDEETTSDSTVVGARDAQRHCQRRQSSALLEAVPRGRIPIPSRDVRRRIGLSGDVVDQGDSLDPAASLVCAPGWSSVVMCRSRRHLVEMEGGQRGGSGAGTGGRKRDGRAQAGWGGGSERDE